MPTLLLSKAFVADFGHIVETAARETGAEVRVLHLPDHGGTLPVEQLEQIDIAYLTRDMRFSRELYPAFAEVVKAAPNLKWLHFQSAAAEQHAFLAPLRARRVAITTSVGNNAEPVAHTAIAALLALARGFPKWLDAQRRHAWEPMRGAAMPRDIIGQTIVIVGLGGIGRAIARFCQALRMHVIGIRRSAKGMDDPVDEMHTLDAFRAVLPRSDWIVLACPLTDETRHLLNAQTLALLPTGAHVINVARGGVVDENALIAMLDGGHIGGAYLDVFAKEPLAPESPLWDMANVIISPHNASVAMGNAARAAQMFAANFVRFVAGAPLINEQPA